ncbi:MAG TPA: AI-2E family transporter [Trueperaceae bacterium]
MSERLQPADEQMNALRWAWRHPWVRAVVYTVLIVAVLAILWRARAGYMFALQVGLFGFLLAYLLNPLVTLLQRLRLRRGWAVAITYLLLGGLIAFGSMLVGQVVTEAASFVNLLPDAFDNLSRIFGNLQARLLTWLDRIPFLLSGGLDEVDPQGLVGEEIRDRVVTALQQLVQEFSQLITGWISQGPGLLYTGASVVISTTLQVVLVVLASVYFLYDFPRFMAQFRRLVPTRYHGVVSEVSEKADQAVGGYLRGQLLITTMLGVFIWLGLTILGVPLATAIAFLAAVFNLVPYLGPVIGAVPAVLLAFTVSPLTALLAVVVFVVANQLEGNLLSPLILSRSTNLHPLTVLLAIMAGLGLFGLVGALLAVPTVAFVKVILEDYVLSRREFATVPPDVDPEQLSEDQLPAV